VHRVISGSMHPDRRIIKNRVDIDVVRNRIFNAHGDTVAIDDSTYVGVTKKALLIDVDYGPWQAYVFDVINGHCHPKRGADNRAKTNLIKYGGRKSFCI